MAWAVDWVNIHLSPHGSAVSEQNTHGSHKMMPGISASPLPQPLMTAQLCEGIPSSQVYLHLPNQGLNQ